MAVSMDRSLRRFQLEKRKRKVSHIYWWADDRLIGIYANTRKVCSCQDCGHARFWRGKTRQEKANELDLEDELVDMNTDYTWWLDALRQL